MALTYWREIRKVEHDFLNGNKEEFRAIVNELLDSCPLNPMNLCPITSLMISGLFDERSAADRIHDHFAKKGAKSDFDEEIPINTDKL